MKWVRTCFVCVLLRIPEGNIIYVLSTISRLGHRSYLTKRLSHCAQRGSHSLLRKRCDSFKRAQTRRWSLEEPTFESSDDGTLNCDSYVALGPGRSSGYCAPRMAIEVVGGLEVLEERKIRRRCRKSDCHIAESITSAARASRRHDTFDSRKLSRLSRRVCITPLGQSKRARVRSCRPLQTPRPRRAATHALTNGYSLFVKRRWRR
ncbi:uncharacterized protein C8Q71DRAFT_128615 [Rhodofomes roseus]|uniref:Secreted protein n=1 Tax=Rhodofomes roseus TaxID=34475 RepID=A0ABQ8KBI6_9APHY|nr:uncharacterized protein C8Q71DRAFT_128615 [Rhodofomes roseus]KAH9834873.1 hypothetical protein C8Q71DRAFT_128615 [Rhodofomes roseus]